MSNITSIQKIIEQKTREKAEKIIQNLFLEIRKSGILDLETCSKKYGIKIGDKVITLRSCFWHFESTLGKILVEDLYNKILPDEIEDFVQRVEDLEKELETLKSGF